MSAGQSRTWIYPCFFLSGFSGLVNEIVWSRLFVYTMGSSHLSIAVVVSMFMGGLALGSWRGGPLADRASSPLRLYGWLVLLAGALSGAVAPLLWLLDPVLGVAYRLHDGDPGHPLFTAVKVVVCAGTILVPTTLMGATLPALTRHLTRTDGEIGSKIGNLYAVNTFGAVAGAAAAGFFLIGMVGLGWSAALGASVDVLVGLLVLWMTRGVPLGIKQAHKLEQNAPLKILSESSVPGPQAASLKPQADRERVPIPVKIAVLAFGISGFANMCLQLGWTRSIIISIGNSTYGFSVIVGIFIFGLAAGGAIAGLFADRLKRPMAAFGWLLVATAVAAGLTIPWLGLSPARFAWEMSRARELSLAYFLGSGALSVAMVILPATVLMGMAFPLVGRLRAMSGGGVGKAVGAAYASNTVGAILGTALTGFVLVKLLGKIWLLLYLAVGLSFLAGAMVLLAAPGPRRLIRHLVLGTVTASLLAVLYVTRPFGVLDSAAGPQEQWHPVIFGRGAYSIFNQARPFPTLHGFIKDMIRVWEPLYYRDGEAASVAVLKERQSGRCILNISGKTEASSGGTFSFDIQTQLLSGHLPLLIHPAPRRALNLGLGGGMSLGAMTTHGELEALDLLELSPEVVEAARLHFAEVNKSALLDPRVRTVIGDGRNHLAHTSMTYDVISSEPSNFWIAGLGNLFTEEFYQVVMKRLNPGGILCQWIYGYNLRLADYQIALRTILRVFPHVTVWNNSYGDTLLLAAREPMIFRRERIARAMEAAEVRNDLATIGISRPEDLFRYFQADGRALDGWLKDGPTNRDLFPVLEFSSPLGYFDPNTIDIHLALAEAAGDAMPWGMFDGFSESLKEMIQARRVGGRALNRFFRLAVAEKYPASIQEFRLLSEAGDPWALSLAAHELAMNARVLKKSGLLHQARMTHDTAEMCIGDDSQPLPGRPFEDQLRDYRAGVRAAPATSWESYLALSQIEFQGKLFDDSLRSLKIAEDRKAPVFKVAHLRGLIQGTQGDLPGAERSLRLALENVAPGTNVERGEILYNLAYCFEKQRNLAAAASAYQQAAGEGKDPVWTGTAQARCLRQLGQPEPALRAATEALAIARKNGKESAEARAEIGRAHAASGNLPEAIQWMESAAQVAPGNYTPELEELRRRAGR